MNARLAKEVKMASTNSIPGVSVTANENNILEWTINFTGPAEYNVIDKIRPCPYAGTVFPAKVVFPANYPFKSPSITFPANVLWHPQVEFKTGNVCVRELEKGWTPVKTVTDVIKFVLNILSNPTVDEAVELDATKELRENLAEYEKKAASSCAALRS